MSKHPHKQRVVILGAGFAGLTAAKEIGHDAEVTVVDRHNYQTFLPLLYQVATASLAADHVAYPIRGALRKTGARFRMGSPIAIDHIGKTVKLDSSEVIPFEHLVFAMGSATADFGVPGVTDYALGMKNIHEALHIRSELMRRFEDLCRFEDDTRLSVALVGGGPTGVEMSGALAELVRGPLRSDNFNASRHIDIYLIEAGPRLLPMFSEDLSERTKRDLEELGVKVLVNTQVKEVKHRQILFADGTSIPSEITVWAAGVKGVDELAELRLPLAGNRIKTESTLQVSNYPYIWAIGDNAAALGANGRPLPMVAPVAMQQGRFLAKQLRHIIKGEELGNFKYTDKGSMATIGRHKAIVEVKKLKLRGPIAWFAWLFLHIFYLLGGRNRIGTIADWMWNYFTFDRGNRHIMDSL
jgi:NADH dehydrogenase